MSSTNSDISDSEDSDSDASLDYYESSDENSLDLQDELDEKEIERNSAPSEVAAKLWNNDIIWKEITSYLNSSDLKDLSLVNKFFLQRVRSLTRVASLAEQLVTGNMEIHAFQLTRAIVEVNQIKEIVLKKRAAKTFQDTEYLEIQHLYGLSTEVLNARLIHIVSNCSKLKSLAFYVEGILDLDAFFTNPKVKLVISNLKELYLDAKIRDRRNWKWESLFADKELQERLGIFKSLFPDLNMKLTSFSCNEYKMFNCSSLSPAVFLLSSQSSLVKLTLNIPFNKSSLADLKTLIFPKLKELTLRVTYMLDYTSAINECEKMACRTLFADHVLVFFQNHFSTLRKFSFCNEDVTPLEPFCEMLKTSTKIETFVLRCGYQFVPLPSKIDWTFLKKLTTLRRFELNGASGINNAYSDDPTTICENFVRYLNVLPPQMESIVFQPSRSLLIDLDYVEWDINRAEVASNLLHFQRITTLKLCSPVDDALLQRICKNLTSLLIFKADLSIVTDFGISGFGEGQNIHTGISLANLKGLRKFEIMKTFKDEPLLITWDGLIRSIRFLELVELIVESPLNSDEQNHEVGENEIPSREIDEQKFLVLLSNNPSLEKVNFQYYQWTPYIHQELKNENPRIKICILTHPPNPPLQLS